MNPAESPQTIAIVPAAGRGLRMGAATKKQFLTLGGEPVLVHALRVLQECAEIDSIILVVPEEDRAFCQDEIVAGRELDKITSVVSGGKERQDSVYAGLRAVESEPDVVVIHDGVRPFLTGDLVREVVQLAVSGISAIVGVPATDTIKSVDSGQTVLKTLSRDALWSIQTPQAFPYPVLLKAHDQAHQDGIFGTDDASLLERLGLPVRVLMGSYENIKITSPEDLVIGEALLKKRSSEKKVRTCE